jgi:hypothetical protein
MSARNVLVLGVLVLECMYSSDISVRCEQINIEDVVNTLKHSWMDARTRNHNTPLVHDHSVGIHEGNY